MNASQAWRFDEWLAVDLRTLALFRVVLALAVIVNAAILLQETTAFFSDQGIYPRSLAIEASQTWSWSLYFLNGQAGFASLLLLATIGMASAMLLGWRTRWATVITWVLVASQVNRTTLINSGADIQLVVLLFWAMFLPLGARFSVDSALIRHPPQASRHFSIAGVAVMLQVMYLYFFGALLKHGAEWTTSFNAVYYALSAVQVASPMAPALLSWVPATQ